jgi:hypothetical protein
MYICLYESIQDLKKKVKNTVTVKCHSTFVILANTEKFAMTKHVLVPMFHPQHQNKTK